jgi:hypothetical protein
VATRGLEAVAQVPLFNDLSRREVRDILAVAEEYEYPAETVMAQENSPGDSSVFVATL